MTSTMDNDIRDKARETAEQAKDMVSEGGAAIGGDARDLARKARLKAETAADQLSDASRDAMETASGRLKTSAREAASALSDAAGELSHVVGDQVSRRAGEMREAIADKGAQLTDSLRDIADRNDLASLPTRAVDTAVNAVASVADRVTNTSFGALIDDVADFAKRRPVVTAVGVAATAFVVMRMMRGAGADGYAARADHGPAMRNSDERRSAEARPVAKRASKGAVRNPRAQNPAPSQA